MGPDVYDQRSVPKGPEVPQIESALHHVLIIRIHTFMYITSLNRTTLLYLYFVPNFLLNWVSQLSGHDR